MTETPHDRARRSVRQPRRQAARKGVDDRAHLHHPGVHPYDEVTWERRDVVLTNWKTGATIFEQRGVEFPDFWSVNASTSSPPSTSAARSAPTPASGASSSSSTGSC